MSRLRSLLTLPTILLAFVGVTALLGLASRYQDAHVVAEVTNETDHAWPVRIHDGWSGRSLGTWQIDAGATVLLIDDRFDEWWVAEPLTADEGRRHAFQVDVLGPDGCELRSTTNLRDDRDPLIFTSSGDLAFGDIGDVGSHETSTARRPTPIADPCGGRPAPPMGIVVNMTKRPIVVGPGVVIMACARRTFLPGDLATPDAVIPADAVRLAIPSIDAQDERWPLEPRSVVVEADQISDSADSGADLEDIGPCQGQPSPTTEVFR